ncbi:hypothetical protein Bca4012_050240 [Brassica carinata]
MGPVPTQKIEEPQSKAASKSSSASPVVVPSPPPLTASSPAPAIAQHAPVATVSNGTRKTVATQYAKKLAKLHRVDIRSVAGTGPFGRITASDVEAAAGIAPSVAAPPPPPPPAAAAKATTTSSSSPPLMPGSSVVPFTAMQSDVSKNMIESLSVPMFRVGYLVNTDALDAPYEKVKPKGVTMTALLAKLQGWLLLSILWPGEELFELPKQHKKRSIHYTKGQEISGKLHLVVHRKSVGPGADQEVKLASTLDHVGNVAQISPLIGFVHRHIVIVDTEPELEKSEFSVMSLEKYVKQLEEERATEETYHHQQRKCKL